MRETTTVAGAGASATHGAGTLAGARAVVTGASRGIGLAIANALGAEGATVVGLSRTGHGGDPRPRVSHLAVDVTSERDVERAIAAAGEPLDICVVNAGAALVEDYLRTPTRDWRALIELNLIAAMTSVRSAARAMLAGGRPGRIVVISSTAGLRAEPDIPIYSATKAALGAFVQALAIRHARAGLTVNAIAPGEIDTALHRTALGEVARRRDTTDEALRSELVADHIPIGRLGRPEDVAPLAVFLASSASAYVTGQTFVVDGGQLLV